MTENGDRGLLDELVELAARAMDALGLRGSRLRWRWKSRRERLAEGKQQVAVLLRSAKGRHKMCPSCRALVPRGARTCPECEAELAGVRAPGIGRLVANVLPGATAATSLILLVNGLLFLLVLMAPAMGGGQEGARTGFSRLLWFDLGTLMRLGGGLGYAVQEYGQWWRLITPIFLHGGLIHFGFNSYVLLQLGPLVEEEYGTERFWVIYLACGIAGNIAAELFRPATPVVGASGAIVGLVGLLLVYGARRGGVAGQRLKSFMTQYALLILVISLLPNVSFLAHAGGFVAGALLGWIAPMGPFRNRATASFWEFLAMGGVLLTLYAFVQVARSGA